MWWKTICDWAMRSTEAVCAFVKTRYKYIRPSMLLEVLELVGTYTQCENTSPRVWAIP